jgi:hemophore-related protein
MEDCPQMKVPQPKAVFARCALATLAAAGLTASAVAFGAGSAAAQPAPHQSPLLSTTCSFAQLDRALHAEFPEAAARLDAHPRRKERLRHLLDLPPAQREAAPHQFFAAHPELHELRHRMMRQWMNAHPDQAARHHAAITRLADTCHSY